MAEREGKGEGGDVLRRLGRALERGAAADPELARALAQAHGWLGELLGRIPAAAGSGEPAEGPGAGGDDRRRPEPVALDAVLPRVRLKAKALRAVLAGDLDGSERAALVDRAAELPGCWLYALEPAAAQAEPARLELAARAYENLALAVEVARRFQDTRRASEVPPADLLYTLAEAQSALRTALTALDVRDDVDQLAFFRWVRDQAFEHRVFIPRYFRADDPADPTRWDELQERLDALAARLERVGQDRRERRRLLSKLGYHLEELAAAGHAPDAPGWQGLRRTLDEWVTGGRSPVARDLGELLVPAAQRWPDDLDPGPGPVQVLHAVDALIALFQGPRVALPPPTAPSHQLQHAATRLSGKRAVLIGGELRRADRARLERDLGLAELRWVVAHAEPSDATLVAAVRATDVDLILFAERWARRGRSPLEAAARAFSKPFVTIPGGYDTHAVARAIHAAGALP